MKCVDCGRAMDTKTESYRYTECGLPYVVLLGVEVSRCPQCGATEVAIPAIEHLHCLIATKVAEKQSLLMAKEIRYLRKYLGFSTGGLAKQMGVEPATVSRWEREHGGQKIGPLADRLLRAMVMLRLPNAEYPDDVLEKIDTNSSQPTRVEVSADEWAGCTH